MSDKITKTVTFEIEPSGDCDNCKSRKDSRCLVFDEFIYVHKYKNGNAVMGMVLMVTENKQCQACKDYLAQEKQKIYCDGCKYRVLSCRKNDFNGCKKMNPQSVEFNKRYSLNCKDREE